MDENVFATLVELDEAEPLCSVEELHCASNSHDCWSLPESATRRQRSLVESRQFANPNPTNPATTFALGIPSPPPSILQQPLTPPSHNHVQHASTVISNVRCTERANISAPKIISRTSHYTSSSTPSRTAVLGCSSIASKPAMFDDEAAHRSTLNPARRPSAPRLARRVSSSACAS